MTALTSERVRLAVLADVHLDASFSWAGPTLGRRLRQAIRSTLRTAVRRAGELGVDALLVGGDLFEDERYAPDTPELLRSLFAELAPTPVLLAPGNHDFAGPASPYRTVEWTANVHVYEEPALSPVELRDGLTLWGAAHDRPAGTPGFLGDGFVVAGAGVHLALFHGAERRGLAVQGAGKALHAPFDEDELAAAGFSHAFVGHFHTPSDSDLLTYPGNLESLTFGETGARGLAVAEVDAWGRVAVRREVVAEVGLYDAAVDATGCRTVEEVRDRAVERLAALPCDRRIRVARLSVSGEVPPDVELAAADLADLPHDLDGVTVASIGVRAAYDLGRIAAEPTVRGAFVRLAAEEPDLGEAERRLVVLAGLRALDGRTDLGLA